VVEKKRSSRGIRKKEKRSQKEGGGQRKGKRERGGWEALRG